MLFDTPVYLIFLPLVVALYWRFQRRQQQNVFLLAASYFFYGWWDWRFLGLIAISTVVDYACALAIERSARPASRRVLLAISVSLNLTFLGFFKYFNFFIDSATGVLHTLGIRNVPAPVLAVVLPPGISFYTFQALAYIVDVYQRKIRATKSLTDYALFISLFPHLIAGPIQRPSHLLPQVEAARRFEPQAFFDGVMLILSGLFRKCVIADNCAILANAAFDGRLGPPSVMVTLVGAYAFAWQIYGDFSGYSDIARGSAQLMGFHFMVNFRQPYLATSLQDFWRRWHISLSTWLRDYFYIPMGGNRDGELRTYRNLLVTMLLGGLWHGASWRFVVWGGIHGTGLALNRFLQPKAERAADPGEHPIRAWLRRIWIFHVVCFAWVFFRASSLSDGLSFLSGIVQWHWRPELATACLFLATWALPMFVIDVLNEHRGQEYLLERFPLTWQYAGAAACTLALLLFSANQLNAFIYFQF